MKWWQIGLDSINVLLKKEVLTWASAKSYRSFAWFPDSGESKTILQKMPKIRAILLVETSSGGRLGYL